MSIQPCPFCSVGMIPFGDEFTHATNDCWLRGVIVKKDEFAAWDRRATIQPTAVAPKDYKLVPIKITPEMIERGIEAHYGKQRVAKVGGARGVSMTVNDTDYNGVHAMRNFWRGALSAVPEAVAPADAVREARPVLLGMDFSKDYLAEVREEARNAALEEAAKVCDEKFEARSDTGHAREASTARSLRDSMRAMKSTSKEPAK